VTEKEEEEEEEVCSERKHIFYCRWKRKFTALKVLRQCPLVLVHVG
jgi:hypothetical protein